MPCPTQARPLSSLPAVEALEGRRFLAATVMTVQGTYPNNGTFPRWLPNHDGDQDASDHHINPTAEAAAVATLRADAALMRTFFAPAAADQLEHFLDGSGTTRTFLPTSKLSRDAAGSPQFAGLRDRVFHQLRTAADRGLSHYNVRLTAADIIGWGKDLGAQTDLFFAVKGTQGLVVSGRLVYAGGRVTGNVLFSLYDTYGFGERDALVKNTRLPNFTAPARFLQLHGDARAFTTILRVSEPFSYVPNLRVTTSAVEVEASFAGVGFRNNPVGRFVARSPRVVDLDPTHYRAQVNWGGTDKVWHPAAVVPDPTSKAYPFLIKASHTYPAATVYHTRVRVTDQYGRSVEGVGATFAVSRLQGNTHTGPQVGTEPPATGKGPRPPAAVELAMDGAPQVVARVGQAVRAVPLAQLFGQYNGVRDATPGHYRAFVNWSDEPGWEQADVLANAGPGAAAYPLLVRSRDSHAFAATGVYYISVYVAGPDGQTMSKTTCKCVVTR